MSRLRSFIAAAGSLVLLGSGAAIAAPSSGPASDTQITDQVEARLAQLDPDLARRLHVTTQDGVVTLSGQATSGPAAAKALHEAQSVQGVVKVRNEMSVTQ